VEAFRVLSATAPHAVHTHTTPDAAEQHVQLLAVADALTICAADRVTLTAATAELVSLDHDHC
jgi:hypothetical protein